MRYLSFNSDVYLVTGAKKSAIYDLNKKILYSISAKVVNLIKKLISKPDILSSLTCKQKELANQLIESTILIPSDIPGKLNNIQELRISYPTSFAWIEVTKQCNLSCKFCYESCSSQRREKMSFDDFKSVIRNLTENNIKRIQLIGGEPLLLSSTLKKMVTYCRNSFEFVEIYTNGTLINDEWCKFFKEQKINIALSLHSYLADEHDKIVNSKGAYRKVSHAIDLLKMHNINFRVATIRNKDCNMGEPTSDLPIKLEPKMPKITGRATALQLNFEMFKAKMIAKEYFQFPLNKRSVQTAVTGHRCFLKNIYIATDLTVYPCVMERRGDYGNLKKLQLKEMMDNQLRLLSKDQIEGCKICEYRYACSDCRPDSNGGGLYQKPWYCTYDPKTGKWLDPKVVFERALQQ